MTTFPIAKEIPVTLLLFHYAFSPCRLPRRALSPSFSVLQCLRYAVEDTVTKALVRRRNFVTAWIQANRGSHRESDFHVAAEHGHKVEAAWNDRVAKW